MVSHFLAFFYVFFQNKHSLGCPSTKTFLIADLIKDRQLPLTLLPILLLFVGSELNKEVQERKCSRYFFALLYSNGKQQAINHFELSVLN